MKPKDLIDQNSAAISNLIDAKEKELSEALNVYQVIEQEKLLLQRKILNMQVRKKDLEIAEGKAGHNIKQINIEIKLLKNKFWNCKNSGT